MFLPSTVKRQVQDRLRQLGLYAGEIDGIIGRQSTMAVVLFQRMRGLEEDGVIGPKTLEAMEIKTTFPIQGITHLPPWLDIARDKVGFIEGESRTKNFLLSDGETLGDPTQLPWCGDFVQTCLALALPNAPLPANPYYALNWLKFGQEADGVVLGGVAVWERKGGGHVAFAVGHDRTHVFALGGNQSNQVRVSKIAKQGQSLRLRGIRYPSGHKIPSVLPFSESSAIATNKVT